MTDNAVILTQAERQRLWPNQRPRDAATLLIVDRTGAVPRVLMGRRHPGHKFMPGKFVFPGGRIEPGDRAMVATGALAHACEARLMAATQRPSPLKARALALAAIRETFEETGLAFGSAGLGTPSPVPAGTWQAFAATGIHPDLAALTYIARAVTPPRRPKRFDTRFFSVDAGAVGAKVEGVVGPDSELVELVWVSVAQSRELDLPTITRVVLDELETRVAAGFGAHLKVPYYREVRLRFRREEL